MYILRYNFLQLENKEYLFEKEFKTLKDLEVFLNVAEVIKNYEIIGPLNEVKKEEVKKERFRIEIRTTEEKKKSITEIAKQNNTTVSKILNDLIDLVIQENTTK